MKSFKKSALLSNAGTLVLVAAIIVDTTMV